MLPNSIIIKHFVPETAEIIFMPVERLEDKVLLKHPKVSTPTFALCSKYFEKMKIAGRFCRSSSLRCDRYILEDRRPGKTFRILESYLRRFKTCTGWYPCCISMLWSRHTPWTHEALAAWVRQKREVDIWWYRYGQWYRGFRQVQWVSIPLTIIWTCFSSLLPSFSRSPETNSPDHDQIWTQIWNFIHCHAAGKSARH